MEIFENAYDIVTSAKESVTDYFEGDTITTRKKILTIGSICLLIGMVTGFIFSPIKKGIYINISNNGNYEPNGKPEENDCCKNKKKGKC